MTIKEKQFAVAAQIRMLDLKTNFKVGAAGTKGRRCEGEEETQEHLHHCPALSDFSPVQGVPLYNDILEDSTKIATISRILSDKYKSFLKPSAPVLSAAAAIM